MLEKFDLRMLARLADMQEFAEMKNYFEAQKKDEVAELGRKNFQSPSTHDTVDWEKLRSYYAGVRAVFKTAETSREIVKRRESA